MSLCEAGEWDTAVKCDSCGLRSSFKKCRAISKTKGLWRCSTCGVKHAQLRRVFGEWPMTTFSLMPPDVLMQRLLV